MAKSRKSKDEKPAIPVDPRFKGATPEKLALALRKSNPAKRKATREEKRNG